ncbi:MAG: hypothetical protein IKM24_06135, partial [Clostridia bacterium]|nr:hypothetical protein [Clostridia bacterium]
NMIAFFERAAAFFLAVAVYLAGLLGLGADPFVKPAENFRVTAYIRADYVQTADSLYAEDFDIITVSFFLKVPRSTARGKWCMTKRNSKPHFPISAMLSVRGMCI